MAPEAETVTLTVEPTMEKAVDIDVSALLDKVDAKAEEVDVKPEPKPANVVAHEPEKKEPVEEPDIEVEITPEGEPKNKNDAIEELRSQLETLRERNERARQEAEAERKAREDAQRIAEQYQTEVAQSKFQLFQAQHQTIVAHIATEKADGDALERAMAVAMQKGDHLTVAKCQRALAKVEARLSQFEDARSQVEEALKAGPKAFQQQMPKIQTPQQQQKPTGDPIEDYISTRSPRVQNFLRTNPKEWLADKSMNAKLIAAHHMALSDGHVEESNSYFDFVKNYMDPPSRTSESKREAKPVRKAVPAAPASSAKAASPQAQGGGTTIRLSPKDRSAAEANGVSESEWARRIHLMRQPGYDGPKFD
jgi:hypothetical protein